MRSTRRIKAPVLMLALLGTAALITPWVDLLRPDPPGASSGAAIVVTSDGDRGPGTLREAIYAANSLPARARIILETPLVRVLTPLPPLVNPDGVIVEGRGDGTMIDGAGVVAGSVMDIRSPTSAVRNVVFSRAPGVALEVRADGVLLDGLRVEGNGVGVLHVSGAGLTVQGSVFDQNGIGLQLAAQTPDIAVRDNTFSSHREAGIWAMGPANPDSAVGRGVSVSANRFAGDRISIVVGNREVEIVDNDLTEALDAAVYIGGVGVRVQSNRLLRNLYGVLAVGASGAEISDNEADGNRAVGILVNSSINTLVTRNRAYRNGYGIVAVFGDGRNPDIFSDNSTVANDFDGLAVVGASPVVRGNEALRNRHAGVRILDFQPLIGPRLAAQPFLTDNVLAGNGLTGAVRGLYVATREGGDD